MCVKCMRDACRARERWRYCTCKPQCTDQRREACCSRSCPCRNNTPRAVAAVLFLADSDPSYRARRDRAIAVLLPRLQLRLLAFPSRRCGWHEARACVQPHMSVPVSLLRGLRQASRLADGGAGTTVLSRDTAAAARCDSASTAHARAVPPGLRVRAHAQACVTLQSRAGTAPATCRVFLPLKCPARQGWH